MHPGESAGALSGGALWLILAGTFQKGKSRQFFLAIKTPAFEYANSYPLNVPYLPFEYVNSYPFESPCTTMTYRLVV